MTDKKGRSNQSGDASLAEAFQGALESSSIDLSLFKDNDQLNKPLLFLVLKVSDEKNHNSSNDHAERLLSKAVE